MSDLDDFRRIKPKPQNGHYSAEHISSGLPIPKPRRIEQFSPDEWEDFIEEWATSLESSYVHVVKFAGSGDKGLDVVGFITDNTFKGGWDNYQCKQYNSPLTPSDIWVEIGKIIYYSFKGEYSVPRKYYFVAPKGIGTSLLKLLADPDKFKEEARDNWEHYCANGISKNVTAKLEGELLEYFNEFDFSIFTSKSLPDLINDHEKTPFHTVRFGGGLPIRPPVKEPSEEIAPSESRYIEQLLEAYSGHIGESISGIESLEENPELKVDFLRQRVRFYHAESLRNFARDTVPQGTFEVLQEEIYDGVIDICESEYKDGFERMRSTVAESTRIPIMSNPLSSVIKIKDKQGICHQLANDDRLIWVKIDGQEED